jgi:hypothetical protein
MNWQQKLAEKFIQYKIQLLHNPQENEFLLVCPKIPEKPTQEELKSVIQENIEYFPSGATFSFQEGPWPSTIEGLQVLFAKAGATSFKYKNEGHTLIVEVSADSPHFEEDSPIWKMVQELLTSDPYIEGWKIKINDKMMSAYDRTFAQIIARQVRPERQTCISEDDILNLKIAVEVQDVNDFINSI